MYTLPKIVAFRLTDPDFLDFPIMFTYSGWWKDANKVLTLVAVIKRGLSLKDTLAQAGISKKEWRGFCTAHPGFDQLRYRCLDRIKYPHMVQTLHEGMPTPEPQAVAVEEVISMSETVYIEIQKAEQSLIPISFFRKLKTYRYSSDSIELGETTVPLVLRFSVGDSVPVLDTPKLERFPNADGYELERVLTEEAGIERSRQHLLFLRKVQHGY